MKIYLIGSLRTPAVPELAIRLRAQGFDVFDDWHGAGPEADDKWQEYEMRRGRHYSEALYAPAATNVFQFDLRHIDESDVGVLALPAGKSGHLELGHMSGKGKPTFIYFPDGEPERWDVMYRFATRVVFSEDELLHWLRKTELEYGY